MPQPKREHSEEAYQYWHKKWNKKLLPTVQLIGLGHHSQQKAYWQATCLERDHCRFLAVDTVNELRRYALKCKPCGQTKKEASQFELKLYRLLSKYHCHFAVEVYLEMTAKAREPLASHPFDAMLIATGLLIEVDGEQHFGSDMMQTTVEEQQQSDDKVNHAVKSAGLCMVRLHDLDTRADWWESINKARAKIEQGDSGFVLYSKSYIKS